VVTRADGALAGVRVLDFTWVLAGPYAARILADLGAEVIKVQSSATTRGLTDDPSAPYFNVYNRNKLGVNINMRNPKGIELAKRVAAISDVVIDNFSTRVMRQWGMDYQSLVEVKPDIICCSISGMGASGPWKDYVSFGPTAQALTGFALLTAYPDEHPAGFGYSYSDHMAGTVAATAVLAALEHRAETGEGQAIDTSQLEATAPLIGPALLDYTVNSRNAAPPGNLHSFEDYSPHGVYACRGEDRTLAIAVTSDDEWRGLVNALGNPDWAASAALSTTEGRAAQRAEIDRRLSQWATQQEAHEAMRVLCACGVPAGVVQDAADLIDRDEQLRHRGFYTQAEHPQLGTVRFDGFPAIFTGPGFAVERSAPSLGQHNDYVFKDLLGLSADELAAYSEAGAFD
jgi:benzylsuccinate CoA-transferase BbsF subunit